MEIIADMEETPRGIYTGCIGYISPGDEAQLSVAIRTIIIDSHSSEGELGIGSGITFDSQAEAEYAECLSKGIFAQQVPRQFHLIESLLHEEGAGYFLLERHLDRLLKSTDYFGFPLELVTARQTLENYATSLSGTQKVRFMLFRNGEMSCRADPLALPTDSKQHIVAFAQQRVHSSDHYLYHKTSRRDFYEAAAAACPACTDLLFLNERDEVTEGASNNVVARIRGELITPPLSSGLLPGVFRAELLATGQIREQLLSKIDLEQAEEIYLINSVRKWRKALLSNLP